MVFINHSVTDGVTYRSVGADVTSMDWGGFAPNTYSCFSVRALNGSLGSGWTTWACTRTSNVTTTRTEVIVDDTSGGFVRGGTASFWQQSTIGYGGHAWWTYNRQSGVDNWGKWTPQLNGPGNYEVFVYIPSDNATTGGAGYRIHHNGVDNTDNRVNQNIYFNAWVSLGTHYFNDASDEYVFMGDETFEASGTRKIAFDAMKFVPR